MTLKQKSKNSLKQWVNRIKRYEVQLTLLYEKLEYLEVRSIGYNSPSFEPRLSSNGSSSYRGIDYWLEKIDACERQIMKYEDEIKKYRYFRDSLESIDQIVLDEYVYYQKPVKLVIEKAQIKRHALYQILEKLKRFMN